VAKAFSTKKSGKRSDPAYKVVGVQLPVALHRKAKLELLCDGSERNFSDLMAELLQRWMERGSRR